jgi:DNA-directed RNA polymerase subunit RPC12/RpoP
MPVELKCEKCGKASSFDEAEIKNKMAECPHCGSTIRVKDQKAPDSLSETMRIDLKDD